jgi:hypothetical protein
MSESANAVAGTPTADEHRPLLFISHRHHDRAIADVIRNFTVNRSGGRVNVFQSSAAAAEGPRIGENLNEELISNLWRASMVFLVYTRQDEDWSYCMWECGVATHPQSRDTKIILFQCGSHPPPIFADQVRVNIRAPLDVHRFVSEFLTSPDFFPRYGRAIAPGFRPDDANVESAAQELFELLQGVAPAIDAEGVEEWPPYPYLRLQLNAEQVARICGERAQERPAAALEVVNEAMIVESDRECARIFGMVSIRDGSSVGELVEGWKHEFDDVEANWLTGLAAQVMDAAQWRFPTLRWELMRGLDPNDATLYAPVVNRVRRLNGGESMQFDIHFDKFTLDDETKTVKVGLPQR